MPIQIEIQDDQVQDLISFYVEKQRRIKFQITELEKQSKEISGTILHLKNASKRTAENTSPNATTTETEYSPKWTWIKKISFAIEKAGIHLTTKEIVDKLTEYEPELISNRKSAVASVSAILSMKSGSYEQRKEFIKIPSEWGDSAFDVWKERKEINAEVEEKANATDEVIDDLPF